MNSIFGMNVIESPFVEPVANVQISPDFKFCSPEFRAGTNQWFRENFGVHDVAYIFQGNIAMNPKMAVMLRYNSREWVP